MILGAALAVAALLSRRSAALRHTIWTAGLVAALAVPLCSILLPSWAAPAATRAWLAEPPAAAAGRLWTAVARAPAAPAAIHGPGGWGAADLAVALWIAGAGAGMLVLLSGALRLAWIAFRSEPLDEPRWTSILEQVRGELRIRRPVSLLQSRSVLFLGTWGVVKPRILVPPGAEQWPDMRIRMVLGHELAHVKRHDWTIQVLAEAARAIYWFNPLFWIACSRLRRESEHACDDTVVRMGEAGTRYAEELLQLTRTLRDYRRLQSPLLAMAQPSHLERRLVSLLNPSLNRLAATPWAVLVVALVAVGVTLPLAAIRARDDKPPIQNVQGAQDAPRPADEAVPDAASVQSKEPEAPTPAIVAPQTSSAASSAAPPVPHSQSTVLAQAGNAAPPPMEGAAARTVAEGGIPDLRIDGPAVEAKSALKSFQCPVSASSEETRTLTMKSTAFGPGPWHISADRTIWAWDQPFVARRDVNVVWMRPVDAALVVSARRLDVETPPMAVEVLALAQAGYVTSRFIFPEAGCWEITGTAKGSTLTFVTRVDEIGTPSGR